MLLLGGDNTVEHCYKECVPTILCAILATYSHIFLCAQHTKYVLQDHRILCTSIYPSIPSPFTKDQIIRGDGSTAIQPSKVNL